MTRIENVEKDMKKIEALIVKLKRFEVDLHNPTVSRANDLVRGAYRRHFAWFDDLGVVPTIQGSLLYHDPRHLDIDLLWTSRFEIPRDEYLKKSNEIEKELDKVWPTGRGMMNWCDFSIEGLMKDLEENDLERARAGENNLDGILPSMVLNGAPIFPEQKPMQQSFAEEIKNLSRGHRYFRKSLRRELSKVIQVRKERRAAL